jgi:hypothetical protein
LVLSRDFTLAEIKTAACHNRRAGQQNSTEQYEIPTFENCARNWPSKSTGRPIGIYPQTNPAFAAAGLRHDGLMVKTLSAFGYDCRHFTFFYSGS